MNHSPLPWKAKIEDTYNDGDLSVMGISDANGKTIIETDCGCYPPRKDDAEFIVHACNSYEELLESVITLRNSLEGILIQYRRILSMPETELMSVALILSKKAIDKAEGKV